jgi:NAD(P)-dependent dehydrogenase (short-subunit alcohol dehydrogenase family)
VAAGSGRRAALVTGAAGALGRTLALALAEDGWAVGLHHSAAAEAAAPPAAQIAAEIAAKGGRAAAFEADLADAAEAASLVPRVAAALGQLACLVNGETLAIDDTAASATASLWDRHAAINLRAPFLLTQAFAAQVPEGGEGVAVNLLGSRVRQSGSTCFSYALSKAGLWSLTRAMALALAPRVRVNGIGAADEGGLSADSARSAPSDGDVDPDDVVAVLRFVLAAPAMTGQMIALGGRRSEDRRRAASQHGAVGSAVESD